QLGTPEQLYRQPNCPFAAEFFGDVNHLTGIVEQGAVSTPFGAIAAPQLTEGSGAQVMIRPEAIKLAGSGVSARVLESRSLGANALLSLELEHPAATQLQAKTGSDNLPAPGASVKLQLDLRGLFVYATSE